MARVQITDRDRELLAFAAEHRLVLAAHAQALVGASAQAAETRLGALASAGLLSRRTVFHRQPPCFQVTRAGLNAIGSDLPTPRLDLRCYRHDIGLGWLWLGARGGAFGQSVRVVSERRMRSTDAVAVADDAEANTFGIRLGGPGPGGGPRLHYPDLLLLPGGGGRIALELELTSKARVRREGILAGYGADPRVDAVVYMSDSRAVQHAVQASVRRLGLGSLVSVQRVRWDTEPPASGRQRTTARAQSTRALVR